MNNLIQMDFAPPGTLQFPRGSQLLFTGPPGVIKSNLIIRYLCNRVKQAEPGTYATTLLTPQQVRERAADHSGKEVANRLRIVDGVSCVVAQTSKEPYAFQSLYNLNTINLVLLQATADMNGGHMCFDSLTTLMTYSSPLAVIKFLQVLCGKMKARRITAFYLLDQGVQDEKIVATLRYQVDGVLESRDVEKDGQLFHEIRLMHVRGNLVDSRWLVYSENGFLDFIPLELRND